MTSSSPDNGHDSSGAFTYRVAIYARYSSEMQNEISLDDQVDRCREEIARRGWRVAGVYTDSAKSGWSLDRDGFQELRAAAERGKFQAVMFWKFDRLARDHNHTVMIKALLRHPEVRAEPDDDGVADYLLLGRRPVDRLAGTCFAGVRALPPAHLLVVTPDGAAAPRRYWDFAPDARVACRSFGEYAEAFHERFAEAVRRRMRSAYPVAVSVSGGLDSSAILCQAEALRQAQGGGPAVLGFSYVGPEGSTSDERSFLDEIERAYGAVIARMDLATLMGLAREARLQAWHGEVPLVDYLWPLTHHLQAAAGAAGARRLLSGHWGDQVLHSTAYFADLLRAGAWRTAARHAKALGDWFLPGEARHLRRQAVRDAVRHTVPHAALPALKWLRSRAGGRHPAFRATETTRDEGLSRNQLEDPASTTALKEVGFLSPTERTRLDLGDRVVEITPRLGHTDSDVSLTVDDPSVIFCGDLYWNAMFPNYVDAIPSKLSESVKALRRGDQKTVYVPGHGALSRVDGYDRYHAMIDEVERAARAAHVKGTTAEAAAEQFSLPSFLGDWVMFNKVFFTRAFAAWYRELEG